MSNDGIPETPEDAATFVDGVCRNKRELVVHTSNLPATVRALRDLLATSSYLFDRGKPIKIVQRTGGGEMTTMPLTTSSMVFETHELCQPVTVDADGRRTPLTLPDRVARMYLDLGEWKLAPLVGITTAPVLAADGAIRDTVGYDSTSRLWCCKVPPLSV